MGSGDGSLADVSRCKLVFLIGSLEIKSAHLKLGRCQELDKRNLKV